MRLAFLRELIFVRRCAGVLLGTTLFAGSGCSLIPTRDDIDSVTTTVKDTVTGKAKRDRQNKQYAEARILERRKEYAAADRMYRELLVEQPKSRDCYHRLAVMAAIQGKFEEANNLYRTALECSTPTPDLWNDVGYCHYMQHQLPEAENALRQALALEPQHRAALNNLATVVGEAGNLDEAYRIFRQGNSEAEAEANFAYVCAQCGELQRAQKHYSRALSFDPEMRSATEALMQVTQRMQMQRDAQASALPQVDAQGQVIPVSHEAATNAPPQRPLIEVFTAIPHRAAAPASAYAPMAAPSSTPAATPPIVAGLAPSAASQTASVPAEVASSVPSPAPTTAAPPVAQNMPSAPGPQPFNSPAMAGMSQPQPPGLVPGTNSQMPQPYSFVQQPQPQYLQPSDQPRSASSGSASHGMTLVNGSAAPPTGAAPSLQTSLIR